MTIHRFIPIITLTLLISACTTSLDVTPVTTAIVVPPVEVQVIKTQEVGDEAQDGGYREEERPAQETAAANEEAQTRQSTWRGEIVELNIGGVIDEFRSSTGVELAGSEVAIFGIKTGAEESAVIYAPGEMLFWHKFNGIWERLSLELNSERDVVGINDEGEVVMKIPGWSKYLAMSSGE